MKYKTKSKTQKRLYKKKSRKINQFGGSIYNNTHKYIDLTQIKTDLQKLVSTYVDLEKAYKVKHGEVMTLYKSYMDLYQTAKSENNKTDESKCQNKLLNINNTILEQEKIYNNNKNSVLREINHIRDYIKDNKQYFIDKLGMNINHNNNNNNNNNLYTFNSQGRNKTIDELKIIEENNDTHKCPRCQNSGMGVIMIPEPIRQPKMIRPVVNQHIYIKEQEYKCPMCMHTQCQPPQQPQQTQQQSQPIVNQQILNLSSLLQQQPQQPQQPKSKTPNKQDLCLEDALRHPKQGIDLQTQIQQCMIQENVSLAEIDVEYLKKHNELMTMYKAYQQLYAKVIEYKDKLDDVKSINVSSILTREQLSKMVGDQARIMSSLSTMQNNMVMKGVLNPSETVDVDKYNGKQLQELNTNLGQQLNSIVSNKPPENIDDSTKKRISQLLKQQQKDKDNKPEFKGKIMQIMGMGNIPSHSLANNNNVSNVNLYKM